MTSSRVAVATLFCFGLVSPAGAGLIPGGGPAASDCYVELDVQNVNGSSNTVTCQDGDPCDVDGLCDGTCTFSLQACLNQPGIAGCTNTGAVTLKKPKLKGARAVLAPDSVKSSTTPTCSPFARVPVKTKRKGKKPGKATVTVTAVSTNKPKRDMDKLTLICTPRVGACPPPTTTSTTSTTVTTTTSTTLPCPGLGIRALSIGPDSHVFSSAFSSGSLPIDVEFAGSVALCAGPPGPGGDSPLSISSDSYAGIKVTANAGFFCAKLDAAGSSGKLYCDGGTAVDVDYSLDSNIDGMDANGPRVVTIQGNPGAAGSAYLTATIRTVLCPSPLTPPTTPPTPVPAACIVGTVSSTIDCSDPTKVDFSKVDPVTLPLTTGTVLAHIDHPNTPGLFGIPTLTKVGQAFTCSSWTTENGMGALVIPFLLTDANIVVHVGDVANMFILDD
jgi:hypothetical protein